MILLCKCATISIYNNCIYIFAWYNGVMFYTVPIYATFIEVPKCIIIYFIYYLYYIMCVLYSFVCVSAGKKNV